MIVEKYNCPNCGYSKVPTTHKGCPEGAGRVVKIGAEWKCDACGSGCGGDVICSSCGEKVPESNVTEVDMQL